jgi:hypothetical protein
MRYNFLLSSDRETKLERYRDADGKLKVRRVKIRKRIAVEGYENEISDILNNKNVKHKWDRGQLHVSKNHYTLAKKTLNSHVDSGKINRAPTLTIMNEGKEKELKYDKESIKKRKLRRKREVEASDIDESTSMSPSRRKLLAIVKKKIDPNRKAMGKKPILKDDEKEVKESTLQTLKGKPYGDYQMTYIKNHPEHHELHHTTIPFGKESPTSPNRVSHLVDNSKKHAELTKKGYKIHAYGEHTKRDKMYGTPVKTTKS